jgi:hypothetical protein
MSKRVWITVVLTAVILLLASTALSAWPTISGLVEQARDLPWTVLAMATVSFVLGLVSLIKLYRTWIVRRNLVRVLARFGAPSSVIANTARLSQDGVALLTNSSGGSSFHRREEVFSGSGKQFTSFPALNPSCESLVNSTLVET